MYGVDLINVLLRRRTWLLGAAMVLLPVAIVEAVHRSPPVLGSGDVTPFVFPLLRNGFYAALTALAVVQPYLLPLAAGLLAGDAIAGEAQAGTLRNLLVRPVGRSRLVVTKYLTTMTALAILVVLVVLAGVVSGGRAFGLGPLPTLSGTTLTTGQTVIRVAASALFMILAVSGVASIGIWISTMTDSAAGAIVATTGVAVASRILDATPAFLELHRWLPTHGWLGFAGLFRYPVDWEPMLRGLAASAAYTGVFLVLAVVGFRRRDVVA